MDMIFASVPCDASLVRQNNPRKAGGFVSGNALRNGSYFALSSLVYIRENETGIDSNHHHHEPASIGD